MHSELFQHSLLTHILTKGVFKHSQVTSNYTSSSGCIPSPDAGGRSQEEEVHVSCLFQFSQVKKHEMTNTPPSFAPVTSFLRRLYTLCTVYIQYIYIYLYL